MNLAFWMVSALLVAIAVAMVVWPLLRRSRGSGTTEQTALLREQLDALKSAHAAGLVADADFAARKQALSAAALALIDAPPASATKTSRSAVAIAIVLALAMPALVLVIYQQIGNPNALGFVGPGPGGASAPGNDGGMSADASGAPDLNKAADTLAAKLAANPQDGEGWMLLGRTYRAIERFTDAKAAFEKARALLPENPDLLAETAEVMGLSSDPRTLAGEPERLLDRALEIDANNQNAMFLKGLARAQADDPSAAEALWERMLPMMETGSSSQISVIEQLNIVRGRLGKAPMPVPTATDGSAAAPMAAAATAAAAPATTPPPVSAGPAAGIEVAVAISPELAAKVEANDVLFVFARAEAGPPMPLAIQRVPAGQLPITLKLDESMGMMAGMSLANFERVVIGARVSKSGNAQGQPGDLETLSAPIAWRSAGKVALTIDRVR